METLLCGYLIQHDPDDEEILLSNKWGKSGKRNQRYFYCSKLKTTLHRLIAKAPVGVCVDHINGNTLDNRKENLRLCSRAENVRNSKMRANNKSGYKGVYWDKNLNKWRAQIRFDYKMIHLGVFESIEDAGNAYKQASKNYFGEFSPN